MERHPGRDCRCSAACPERRRKPGPMLKGLKNLGLPASIVGLGLIASAAAMAGTIEPDSLPIEDMSFAQSLTGTAGDPASGRAAFADRKKGNCLACHENADLSKELFHGDVGPSLDGVASRWEEPQLRAIVMNSKAVFGEQTVMPGFYTLKVGANVDDEHKGKTILTAQEVEDVVSYLMTLKDN